MPYKILFRNVSNEHVLSISEMQTSHKERVNSTGATSHLNAVLSGQ